MAFSDSGIGNGRLPYSVFVATAHVHTVISDDRRQAPILSTKVFDCLLFHSHRVAIIEKGGCICFAISKLT